MVLGRCGWHREGEARGGGICACLMWLNKG